MTNRNRVRLSKLFLALSLALAAAPVFAQSTSAALGGRISGADGKAVSGADVTITHVESGSVSHAMTGDDGRFSARGLRVGGPYKITITKDGVTETRDNVYLALSETTNLDATIGQAAVTTIAAVQVTGANAGSLVFSPTNMGAGTTVTRQQIEALPSIKRSIEDYVRLDPRIVQIDKERGGIAAAGQNNRYNNIKIDGVPTNDQFGLNDSGLPALNQPISIDWIQEFNIGISDYDVTASDFVGANINAVTKSGTNDFKGSVYGVYRNNDMLRNNADGSKFAGFTNEWTGGAYFGGPLITDKLFFFVGYEKFKRAAPGPDKGIIGSSSSNIVQVSQSDLDAIQASAARLGFANIGSVNGANSADNTDKKVFAKLDWNISDGQRLSFRYNKTDGSVARFNTTSNLLQFDSNFYQDNISFENYAANLYSDWSENFSTEANVSYSKYRSLPTPGAIMPQVNVTLANGAQVLFGTERSRQANRLAVNTWTGYFAGDYFHGDHTIRGGFDYEKNDIFNLFLQDTYGNYDFSFANFTNPAFDDSTIPFSRYRFQRANSGDVNSAASNFSVGTLGLFAQDTWVVNSHLTINYGLRVDQNIVDGTPAANAQALADFGVDNTNTIDGATTIEPRFGFNYTFDGDLKSQLRGGIGLFTGSAPGVWLSNSFSNPGVLASSFDIRNGAGLSTDPNSPMVPSSGSSASQLVNFLSPDFKQPTVWKANLAYEHELGIADLVGGVELLLTKVRDGVRFDNLAIGAPVGTLPDGRDSYWSSTSTGGFSNPTSPSARVRNNCILVDPNLPFDRTSNPCRYTNAVELSNTNKGESQNFTVFLEKPWKDNWTAKLAYTYGNSDEVSPGTSSVALSNWQNRMVTNPNEDIASTSNYEIKDRFTGSFSYKFDFFAKAPTTVSFFWEGRSGRPFSYGFKNDANGDGQSGNDLFYIPVNDVAFTGNSSAADIAAFNDYLSSNGYLSAHRGQIAQRNAVRAPWVNQIDVRLSQKLPLFSDSSNAELFLDIQNFGNLLNKKWGRIEQANFPYNVNVANFAGVNAQGQYVYDVSSFVNEGTGAVTLPGLSLQDAVGQSRWSAQIGFRINF